MSIVRWNLKEAAGKALARRTEIAYEACKLDEEANVFKVRYLYGKLVRRCGGRGRNLGKLIAEELTPLLRGWMNYFRLAEVKGIFEELDSWIRRKLRCLIWRHWKRTITRAKGLMQRGLDEVRA